MKRLNEHARRFGAVGAALLLLCLAAAYRGHYQVAPANTAEYHQHVRQAADGMPMDIGSWTGQDVPVTAGAVELLHPNVIISRRYTDLSSGRAVNFLLVQCSDARDILGHYPPVCYVVHGWNKLSAQPRAWDLPSLRLKGTEYEFSRLSEEQVAHIVVDDFMLLPDGRSCREMDEVETAARAYPTRFFGAAQVQLQFDATIPSAERDQIFNTILTACKPILDQIGSRRSSE